MAYIPNFFEQNPNVVPGVFQGLLQGLAPDFLAKQKFDQLVQQDPMLLEQIANMDDGQRATYSKALGAKNKNPLAAIGVGSKRKEREDEAKIIAGMTPDELATYRAGKIGFTPQAKIDRQKVVEGQQDTNFNQSQETFGLTKKNLENNIAKDDLELKAARTQHDRNEALLKAIPKVEQQTIKELADSIVFNRPFRGDPMLAERVKADRIYSSLLDDYVASNRNILEQNARKNLAELKTPQEKMWGFQFFKDAADNARADRDKAQQAIKDLGIVGAMDPAKSQEAQARLALAQKNYETMNNAYIDYGKSKLGVSVESPEDQVAAQIAAAIVSGQGTLQEFEASNRNPAMLEKVRKILSGATLPMGKTAPPGSLINNQFPGLKR